MYIHPDDSIYIYTQSFESKTRPTPRWPSKFPLYFSTHPRVPTTDQITPIYTSPQKRLVKAVRAKGGRLRAMGALHSWSNIFPENGTDVVFLDRLKGIAQDPADYSIVTVQGTYVCKSRGNGACQCVVCSV